MTSDDPEEQVYDIPVYLTPPLPSSPEQPQDISDQTYLTPLPAPLKLPQEDPADGYITPLPPLPELPQDNPEEHVYEDPREMP